MRHAIILLTVFTAIVLSANTRTKTQNEFFNRLTDKSLILHENNLVRGAKDVKHFVSEFDKKFGEVNSYEKTYSIEVNATLDYEIGEIQTRSNTFSVMFLKRKDDNSSTEFLVIYKKIDSESQQSKGIDQSRMEWMELCNSHQASELVKRLYTADAFYYNRGRLIQGTTSITQEYSYMNSPNYSLTLTPKHVAFVTSEIAYEIGKCSGSYPNPYMLLWQKQADGSWKVLMDSNY